MYTASLPLSNLPFFSCFLMMSSLSRSGPISASSTLMTVVEVTFPLCHPQSRSGLRFVFRTNPNVTSSIALQVVFRSGRFAIVMSLMSFRIMLRSRRISVLPSSYLLADRFANSLYPFDLQDSGPFAIFQLMNRKLLSSSCASASRSTSEL